MTFLVHPWHLGGLPTDECAAGLYAALCDSADHGSGLVNVQMSTGKVVKEVERFRPLYDKIIDGHRNQIDTSKGSVKHPKVETPCGNLPIVPCIPASAATCNFVPTPSVPLTNTGSRYPVAFKSKTPPKPPISASEPVRLVRRTKVLMRWTRELPASMDTPASA